MSGWPKAREERAMVKSLRHEVTTTVTLGVRGSEKSEREEEKSSWEEEKERRRKTRREGGGEEEQRKAFDHPRTYLGAEALHRLEVAEDAKVAGDALRQRGVNREV